MRASRGWGVRCGLHLPTGTHIGGRRRGGAGRRRRRGGGVWGCRRGAWRLGGWRWEGGWWCGGWCRARWRWGDRRRWQRPRGRGWIRWGAGGWGRGRRTGGGGVGHASAEDLHLAQGQRDVSVIVGYRAGAQELHDDVAPNDGLVAGQVVPGKAGNGVEGAQRVGGGVHRSVHKAHAHGKVHEGQAGTAHSRTRCVGERA